MDSFEYRFRNPQRNVASFTSARALLSDGDYAGLALENLSYQVVAEAPLLCDLARCVMPPRAWRERRVTNLAVRPHYACRGLDFPIHASASSILIITRRPTRLTGNSPLAIALSIVAALTPYKLNFFHWWPPDAA